MISVCIATYNGDKYIKEQLESIIPQLDFSDEIIISDDSSTDQTLPIVQEINDNRIKIYSNNVFHSPILNFENAIKKAKGDYIFLCDQDDIWQPNKVDIMLESLKTNYLVVSDCVVVDKNKNVLKDSFFNSKIPSMKVWNNLLHNNFLGCCMAFRKEILNKALPFPPKIAMHDIWLGLCGAQFYNATFIPNKLILYRRHGNNASSTSGKSELKFGYKIVYRLYFLYYLLIRMIIK